MKTIIRLKATEKYEAETSRGYYLSHQAHFTKRLAWLRETLVVRKALQLAGSPRQVLDIPCGAGQYWPVLLAERADRQITAADGDLRLPASKRLPAELNDNVRLLRCSPASITLPVQSVDAVLCMRLFHHLGEASDRVALLREFARVTRDCVIVSVWTGNHFKALRRQRTDRLRGDRRGQGVPEYQNRYVLPTNVVEAEFRAAGFRKIVRLESPPFCGAARVYVLQK